MIRRTDDTNEWDGIDRRRYGVDRRSPAWYDDQPAVIERVDRVVEVQQPQPAAQSAGFKFLSNGAMISICFSIITAIGGFVFKLYENVTTLDYKQQTIFEKIEDTKQSVLELKGLLKENEISKQKINDHISSVEETVMDLYRQKKYNEK